MNNNVLNKGNKQEIHENLKRRQEKSISRKIKSSSITKSDNLKIKKSQKKIFKFKKFENLLKVFFLLLK